MILAALTTMRYASDSDGFHESKWHKTLIPQMYFRDRKMALTAIFHTKNCQTKNLWVKIPRSLR